MIKLLNFILPIIFLTVSFSCSNKSEEKEVTINDCTFNRLSITAYDPSSNEVLDRKILNDCYEIKDDDMGLREIFGLKNSNVKVLFYKEEDNYLDVFLNTSEPIRWRTKNNNNISITQSNGYLFIASDENAKMEMHFYYDSIPSKSN